MEKMVKLKAPQGVCSAAVGNVSYAIGPDMLFEVPESAVAVLTGIHHKFVLAPEPAQNATKIGKL